MAENILHYGAVRMRVTGAGNLLMTLYSLDEILSEELVPFDLDSITDREPTRLSNFKSQRAKLRIKTEEIDDQFKVNRVIVFAKELWTSFPG